MKHTLKHEVLAPIMLIHIGVLMMLGIIIAKVPSEPIISISLMAASLLTVGGSIVLWRFVVSEMISIKKCQNAIVTGNVDEFHTDRDDELGDLEMEIMNYSMKKVS